MRFIHSFPSSIQVGPPFRGPSVREFNLSGKPGARYSAKSWHEASIRVRLLVRHGGVGIAVAVLVCDPGADLRQPRDRDDPFAVADLEHDDPGFAAAGDTDV